MNESTVSSPLLTTLRKLLPEGEFFKHADVGMIGLPDASCNFNITLWLEFKLHRPAKDGPWTTAAAALEHFQKKAPTQAEVCKRLAKTTHGHCWYVIWRKKVREVWVCNPTGTVFFKFRNTPEVAEWVKDYLFNRLPAGIVTQTI